MNGIVDLLSQNPSADRAVIDARRAVRDPLWAYERADGMRITVPWSAPDLPPGILEMDFACGEALLSPPVLASLQADGGAPISLLTVTPELSLAWKLQWLVTDHYAQGKDLYDAALLAEHVVLPPDLVEWLIRELEIQNQNNLERGKECAAEAAKNGAPPEFIESMLQYFGNWSLNKLKSLVIDWDEFVEEYPSATGTQSEWLQRLLVALKRSSIDLDHL